MVFKKEPKRTTKLSLEKNIREILKIERLIEIIWDRIESLEKEVYGYSKKDEYVSSCINKL